MKIHEIKQLDSELLALLQEKLNISTKYDIFKIREEITPILERVGKIEKEMFSSFSEYKLVSDIPADKRKIYDEKAKEFLKVLEKEEVIKNKISLESILKLESNFPYSLIFKITKK